MSFDSSIWLHLISDYNAGKCRVDELTCECIFTSAVDITDIPFVTTAHFHQKYRHRMISYRPAHQHLTPSKLNACSTTGTH